MNVLPPPDSPPRRVRFWTAHPSKNKLVRVSRSPSPTYQRTLDRWAEATKRETMDGLVRFVAKGFPLPRMPPLDPNTTWALNSGSVFGLNPGVVPDCVDLLSPHIGRVFNWQPEGCAYTTPLAIFPADPANPLCPPYPGLPPLNVDNPERPVACFSDGGLGKWDPCYFPQLYDPARPWLGFHNSPRPDSWWHGNSNVPAGYRSDLPFSQSPFRSPELHYLPVTEFYVWKQPGRPDMGGHWNQKLLTPLFVARTIQERRVLERVQELCRISPGFDVRKYNLPWYDELGFDEARKWTTWQEGRDALGRMLRYIAELEAFNNWLWAKCCIEKGSHLRVPPCPARPRYYMGTWATTISSQAEWKELHQGFIPVYIISQLPADHLLVMNGLKLGGLDAGEQYRDNRFDAAHSLPSTTISLPSFPPSPQPAFLTFPRENPLPSTISLPLFPQGKDKLPEVLNAVRSEPSSSDAHGMPWTSYLLTHSLAKNRVHLRDVRRKGYQQALLFKEQCRDLFYYVPPKDEILRVDTDPHPFFWVSTVMVEHVDTHYEEKFNKDLQYWWFEHVRDKRLKLARRLPYAFSYPKSNITIHSAFPFPGKSRLLGRIDRRELSEHVGPDLTPRRYFKQRPDPFAEEEEQEPDYEWIPSNDVVMEDPIPDDVPTDVLDTFENQWAQLEEALDRLPIESEDGASSLLGVQVLRFSEQRVQLELLADRKLFKPVKALRAISVTPWQISDKLDVHVWPLRFTGLHGDASRDVLLSMLVRQYNIRLEDIIVVITQQELDCSKTIDLGLRYAEDALWLWCLLHGTMADGCHIEVYPLKALKGHGKVLELPTPTFRPGRVRAQRLQALLTVVELWPVNGEFAPDGLHETIAALSSRGKSSSAPNEYCPVFPELTSLHPDDTLPRISWSLDTYNLDGKMRTKTLALSTACEGELNLSVLLLGGQTASTSSQREVSFRQPAPKSLLERLSVPPSKPYDHPPTSRRSGRSRGFRKKLQCDADDVENPENAKDMNCKQQRSLAAAMTNAAFALCTASIIALKPFEPGPSLSLDKLFVCWWDWLDQSRHLMDSKQDEPEYADHDWRVLESVFRSQARLRSVYGVERRRCQAVLEKRTPWVSMRQVNSDSLHEAMEVVHGSAHVAEEGELEEANGDAASHMADEDALEENNDEMKDGKER
ncbi:hypothetical protein CPB86DRAFT_820286 [Serendipita vermifera]|nr:hypothetical protein CPB86DRAFT_820286 [Serendipita vermifera]